LALGGTKAAAGLPFLSGGGAPLRPEIDKRAQLFSALDALAALAQEAPVSFPLPPGLLGEVRLDAARCTLCGVCARLCPTEALAYSGSLTRLAFTEAGCVQCGLCVRACPEHAVTMTPRLLTSAAARNAPRVAAEADLFPCTSCGKPFAPRALIERSRALMADHPMFQGAQAHLMTLCPDCRQRAMSGATADSWGAADRSPPGGGGSVDNSAHMPPQPSGARHVLTPPPPPSLVFVPPGRGGGGSPPRAPGPCRAARHQFRHDPRFCA
jgi:ferredoxin